MRLVSFSKKGILIGSFNLSWIMFSGIIILLPTASSLGSDNQEWITNILITNNE